mmetsp:Transcript_30101/g.36773  ORF Transcript_30101/g.36773 Transcript_30101/m.36773 type:complete len:359 (+) Transcript_30101:72-1148(+)
MSLTAREIALAIVPKISGSLSMLGSSMILKDILSDQEERSNTYRRLMSMISAFDLVSSFSYFLSTWPIPQGENKGWNSPYHYAAVGNATTCTAQGFGIQIGITTVLYNVMLSVYYVFMIRRNTGEKAVQGLEPYLLGIPLIIGLSLAVTPYLMNLYNNSNLWCWIAPDWSLCETMGLDNSECFKRTNVFRWVFYYGPLWISAGCIMGCLGRVWWTVRNKEEASTRWRVNGAPTDNQYSRRVAQQAFSYAVIFAIVWLPYCIMDLTGIYFHPHDNGFWVMLLVTFCQPLQGFLNFLIYRRHVVANVSTNATRRMQLMFGNSTTALRSRIRGMASSDGVSRMDSHDSGIDQNPGLQAVEP